MLKFGVRTRVMGGLDRICHAKRDWAAFSGELVSRGSLQTHYWRVQSDPFLAAPSAFRASTQVWWWDVVVTTQRWLPRPQSVVCGLFLALMLGSRGFPRVPLGTHRGWPNLSSTA